MPSTRRRCEGRRMHYIIARKPSGVFYVVTLYERNEWVLYDLAMKKLFSVADDAEKECRKMNKERIKTYHKKKASQMELGLEEVVGGGE